MNAKMICKWHIYGTIKEHQNTNVANGKNLRIADKIYRRLNAYLIETKRHAFILLFQFTGPYSSFEWNDQEYYWYHFETRKGMKILCMRDEIVNVYDIHHWGLRRYDFFKGLILLFLSVDVETNANSPDKMTNVKLTWINKSRLSKKSAAISNSI